MNTKVKVGSIWSTPVGVEFVVTAVARNGEEIWIVYKKIVDNQSYSCLEPAFINRFSEITNRG